MSKVRDAQAVGAHIEQLLDAVEATGDPAVRRTAEDLVRTLMEFYGDGLSKIVEIVERYQDGTQLLRRLADDALVGGLLILHDLHPQDTEERVRGALERVRPYLGSHSGDVELLGLDDEGVVHLRLAGSCNGCPSSTVTVKMAIEGAIEKAAPEVTGVEVEGVVPEPAGPGGRKLLPLTAAGPGGEPSRTAEWIEVDDLGAVAPGALKASRIAGTAAVVCNVDGSLYAYLDRCAACGRELASGTLSGRELRCAGCGHRYDIRAAGR